MKNRLYSVLPYIIFVLSIGATIFLWNNAVKLNNIKKRDAFNSIVRQVEASIKDRMIAYADAHYAGAGLFQSSDHVSLRTWRKFVESINVIERYPGINGIGYAVEVQKKDSLAFLDYIHKDVPGLKIRSLNKISQADNMFIIKYLEPISLNHPAIGFDMGSEPKRRAAMERAKETGKPIISRKVNLVQDQTNSSGFLLYVPFYKNVSAGDSVEVTNKQFKGWIYAPFITKDFIEGILHTNLKEVSDEVDIEIYDSVLNNENLLYSTGDNIPVQSPLTSIIYVPIFGQVWAVRLNPTQDFLERYKGGEQVLFLVIGVLLSFSLFYSAYLLARTRNQAVELAEKMTLEIRRKNTEFESKNLELERSNRDLEQFAYVASHDLKEPLRMIMAYVQLLEKRYKNLVDEEGRLFISFVTEGAERMNSLINDLLDYSRVGRIGAEMRLVNLNKVLDEVLVRNELLIEETGTRVIKEEMPEVYASENYLYSLFQNLISNGIKFRRDSVPPVIKIQVEKKGKMWQFSVADNGIGISKAHYDRIFVIFQRLHTRDKYPGTGIGLAICKKIVEYHGGEIWAESKEGEGTTIFFTLPVYHEEKPETI